MTVSQQISPSALRSYKLSKYANGQPGKMLLEAKRVKRVTSQFMSKNGAKEAAKRMKALKKTASTTKKVQDAFFKKMPGGATPKNSGIAGGHLLSIVLQGGLALAVIHSILIQNFINDRVDNQFLVLNNDLSKNLTFLTTLSSRMKNLDTKVSNFNAKITKELDVNAKDYARLNKQTETIAKSAADAKKQSNDALYETREGRKIVTGLAEAARKLGNDALYETRESRKIVTGLAEAARKLGNDALYEARANKRDIDSKITSIQQQVNKFATDANKNFQQQIQVTVANIQKGLAEAKAQANVATETNGVQSNLITTIQGTIKTLNTGLVDLRTSVVQIVNGKVQPLEVKQQQTDQKIGATLTTIEGTVAGLNRTYQLSYEAQAAKWNADLGKLQGRVGEVERVTVSSSSKSATADLAKDLNLLKQDIPKVKSDIETNKADIAKINTRLKDQEKVNSAALPKLDQILGFLPLIPARAAAAIRPDIPTIPQIETAAATGTCRTTQPGGCMNRALRDNAADITNNNNNNAANILDALNTGANAALLAGQQTILQRLGDQLPGGIGGKLSRFAEWMHLDRVLNILIFAATVHNGLMLSNDIGQTLVGAINNILQLIGLKKEDGSGFDVGSVISGSIENLIKGAIGADNYVELKEAWAKANRIYQATTNVLNSFLNLSQTILQASELIAAYTGSIGNALKKGGVVLESAYNWMNPQPKFNRVTQFLEGLQNGASTIQMVTQAPLDVINATTDFTTASTEFLKAIKEDDKPENKATHAPEPDELKAKEQDGKTASQPFSFDFSDLFDGED